MEIVISTILFMLFSTSLLFIDFILHKAIKYFIHLDY